MWGAFVVVEGNVSIKIKGVGSYVPQYPFIPCHRWLHLEILEPFPMFTLSAYKTVLQSFSMRPFHCSWWYFTIIRCPERNSPNNLFIEWILVVFTETCKLRSCEHNFSVLMGAKWKNISMVTTSNVISIGGVGELRDDFCSQLQIF